MKNILLWAGLIIGGIMLYFSFKGNRYYNFFLIPFSEHAFKKKNRIEYNIYFISNIVTSLIIIFLTSAKIVNINLPFVLLKIISTVFAFIMVLALATSIKLSLSRKGPPKKKKDTNGTFL